MINYILLIIIIYILLISFFKGIDAYGYFIEGCKECMNLFYSIYPSLLAIILLVRLVEASEVLNIFDNIFINIPKEVILMSFFRPLSGNASLAILIQIFEKYGSDSLAGVMGSVIQGATDTTFYVIALYFGSINIKKSGNTILVSLLADIIAITLGIYFVLKFF